MPLPKISAVLNNCPLHALTPELVQEIFHFAEIPAYDNNLTANYLYLKECFAKGYGFRPETFNWKTLAALLKQYNPHDQQLILGPILRQAMKKFISEDENTPFVAEVDGLTVEQFIIKNTETSAATARYFSLAPDELYAYICRPLGLSLCYIKDDTSKILNVVNEVAYITIYHSGRAEGAQAGGHWERVPKRADAVDYENAEGVKLAVLTPLLGSAPDINPYGFKLLKKHVQLTAKSIQERKLLINEFSDLILSAMQIDKYRLAITLVKKATALKLLGLPIAADALEFINQYQSNLPKDYRIESYLCADHDKKPELPDEDYRKLVNQLLEPIQIPHLQIKAINKPLVQELKQAPKKETEHSTCYSWLLNAGIIMSKVLSGIVVLALGLALALLLKTPVIVVGSLLGAGYGFYHLFKPVNKAVKTECNDLSFDMLL